MSDVMLCWFKLEGNLIANSWYRHLRYPNGKANMNAIAILAEIFYWYRPKKFDPTTGDWSSGQRKKFRDDKLQKSYKELSAKLGITKKQATLAVDFLVDQGILIREFRTVTTTKGVKLFNVMYLSINTANLEKITYPTLETKRVKPLQVGILQPSKEQKDAVDSDTYSQSSSPQSSLSKEIANSNSPQVVTLSQADKIADREAKVRTLQSLSPILETYIRRKGYADDDTFIFDEGWRFVRAAKRLLKYCRKDKVFARKALNDIASSFVRRGWSDWNLETIVKNTPDYITECRRNGHLPPGWDK